ncbi:MAG: lysine exporter LysO family protein, partial [Desulfovibrio sp.]|nr:lysine exporter LysO family protein [Desulfovibrio sp.]
LFLVYSLADCLAVGAGCAYYSLSSVFITQYRGEELGTVALLANIFRELFTLVFTPLLVRLMGAPAPIMCGGASTMDTTLPGITRAAGTLWTFPSIVHAMVLDFSVPFWVTLFCSL